MSLAGCRSTLRDLWELLLLEDVIPVYELTASYPAFLELDQDAPHELEAGLDRKMLRGKLLRLVLNFSKDVDADLEDLAALLVNGP